ncbi:polyprenyl synthetase family protein [Allokutzneria sp. A3M-2-11 16]|uniref:polyprenyl synthetase family protein n=1 Tax=Allokutzneria sp. A3M-2-11 16 TaxID=2962043 RepID=UPI0020B8C97E|nr:polyprenyl synthetase family protein [Allokutzneria sp. A3M-2-11 16]MCP3805525.1 polyprenyl synthetase family protein [Allokutzneria sp. A3M-2-11 16]
MTLTPDKLGQSTRELLTELLTARSGALPGQLGEMLRYALLPAGKMMRPALTLEAAAVVGGDPALLSDVSLAVEYLHVATLVHDDIIDGDLTRRGRNAVHARYGVANGIVAGDALLFRAFDTLTAYAGDVPGSVHLAAVRAVAGTGMALCEGQVEEALLVGDPLCSLDRYLHVVSKKTGALFRCACEIGALFGGADPRAVAALGAFGDHLGRAFQMHDDLLPYAENPEQAGKSASTDVANGRPTLPVLIGRELAGPAERARIDEALSGRLLPREAHRMLADVLEDLGALDAARERTRAEAETAKGYLADFADTAVLRRFADIAVDREW